MTEITQIHNLHELAIHVTKHYQDKQNLQETKILLDKWFLFGYRCKQGEAIGFCYVLNINGFYLLDACNEGLKMFLALSVVRKVIKETFLNYSDKIFCAYEQNDAQGRILTRRLGFEFSQAIGDVNFYCLQKR